MTERAAYSRVYWSIVDDKKFESVYDNDKLLAGWLRLLLIADQSHPASGHLPTTIRRASVKALSDVGLIDLQPNGRFRVHGLDAERGRRRDAATSRPPGRGPHGNGTVPEPDLSGSDTPGLRRDKTRQDEPSARASDNDDGRADLEAFLLLTRRAPTPRQRKLLDGLVDRHDLVGPEWAADIMLRHPDDPIGAVIEADKAWRAERIAEAQAAEKPTPKPHRRRGLPESTREILDHWAAQAKKEPAQ